MQQELNCITKLLVVYISDTVILCDAVIIVVFYFKVFAAPYSLRFPRIDRVRYDKPWHECLDVECKISRIC